MTQTAQVEKEVIRGFALHCHHDVLFEWVTDYDERVAYIKTQKPPNEVELRLRLFKLIPVDRLPSDLLKAWEAYDKAREAYDKAREAYDKAREAYDKAWKAYDKAWKACDKAWKAYDKAGKAYDKAWEAHGAYFKELHNELCPSCPWDGKTIFPKEALRARQ